MSTLVNPDFIMDCMRQFNCPYFILKDINLAPVYMYIQPGSTVDAGVKEFAKVIARIDEGCFNMEIFENPKVDKYGTPNGVGKFFKYQFVINPSVKQAAKQIAGIVDPIPESQSQNVGRSMFMDPLFEKFLDANNKIAGFQTQLMDMNVRAEKDKEIRDLKEMYEKKIAELESTKGLQGIVKNILPELAPGLLGQLNGFLQPKQPPINGVADPIEQPAASEKEEKEKIVAAIKKLASIDPDFSENISRLAALAEKDPSMYQSAITMLNKFAS